MMEKPLQSEPLSQEVLPAYKNHALSVEDRLLDLLSRMDIEEKVAQMICLWRLPHTVLFNDEGRLDEASIRRNLHSGIGRSPASVIEPADNHRRGWQKRRTRFRNTSPQRLVSVSRRSSMKSASMALLHATQPVIRNR